MEIPPSGSTRALGHSFPRAAYQRAELQFQQFAYDKCRQILDEEFSVFEIDSSGPTVPMWMALRIYGCSMLSEMDTGGFSQWRANLSARGVNLAQIPELVFLVLWATMNEGHIDAAGRGASEFISQTIDERPDKLAGLYFVRGLSKLMNFEPIEAVKDFEIAYALYNILRDDSFTFIVANRIAWSFIMQSCYSGALLWFRLCEDVAHGPSAPYRRAMLLHGIGVAKYKSGDMSGAIEALEESLEMGEHLDWSARKCFANLVLGNIHVLICNRERARKYLVEGFQLAVGLSLQVSAGYGTMYLGDILRDEGNVTLARDHYERALSLVRGRPSVAHILPELNRRLGECFLLSGDHQSARELFDSALQMIQPGGDSYEEGIILRAMAMNCLAAEQLDSAARHIGQSCLVLEEIGARFELGISCLRRAEIAIVVGDSSGNEAALMTQVIKARHSAGEAASHFEKAGAPLWANRAQEMSRLLSARRARLDARNVQGLKSQVEGKRSGRKRRASIVFKSDVMRQTLSECDVYAGTELPILIQGETGTGKELIAEYLHDRSNRMGPLVAVNVAAIPQTMFEREFFGHVRGAFSSADRDGVGFAERANGGTLFLDEIGELPLDLQPKLLRLLEHGTYYPLGDSRQRSADVRVIAATNADLQVLMRKHAFREDLYYRLSMATILVPPLRDRQEDIVPLMDHFLSRECGVSASAADFLNPSSLQVVYDYGWPGNVRELSGICRLLALQRRMTGTVRVRLGGGASGGVFLSGSSSEVGGSSSVRRGAPSGAEQSLLMAIERAGGNRLEAARALGVSRSTLYRRLKKLDRN